MRRILFSFVAALLVVSGQAGAGAGGDPLFAQQWNLELIDAPEAWQTTRGDGALIAILDGATDVRHPDLRANVAGPGFDALNGRPGTGPAEPHGTFVAGIAAAVGDNGEGISGVAPEARILPVTVCKRSECPATAIAGGIRYATRRGADVVNLSLYVPVVDEDLGDVFDAIDDARARGVVVVAAAGNNREPWCVEPAASVLCVGAVDESDLRTTYSNGDLAMQSEYLVAPGGSDLEECDGMIVSTSPASTPRACAEGRHYARSLGTSAAAPHVAGVVALLAAMGTDFGTIEYCILNSTDDLGPPGRDPLFGYGRLNAAAAVACAGE